MTQRPAARVYRPTRGNIALLARRLQRGELVAVPTETVYGLAANALDAKACRQIFRAKGRPANDPLIVHIYSLRELAELCVPNAAALALAKHFWPGPLTLVLPKTDRVPGIVTSGGASVAIRMPQHPVFRRLLKSAGLPLAAPSANPFGYISPTSAEHVRQNLGSKIRTILDGGPSRIGLESTIVDLRDPTSPRLLRPGAISAHDIERVLGIGVSVVKTSASTSDQELVAPGMLLRHYSPRTPVILHDAIKDVGAANEAYIFMRKPAGRRGGENVFWLDERGRLSGVARRLFATLREVDAQRFRRIHVELAAGDPFAEAINDRLRRAAAR